MYDATGQEQEMQEDNQGLVAELCRYKNMRELRRSAAFRRHHPTLRRLFNTPRIHSEPLAWPRLISFLRIVAWNIEYGRKLDGVIHAFNTHPLLRFADLILLSEVDDGMARSGNHSVAAEIGREIGAHAIYGVEYLELTTPDPEDGPDSSNTTALHGNAILTRYPFDRATLVRLPRCEKNFESAQKRLGGRLGLVVDLEIGPLPLVAAVTHLDVVNAPRCRQKQLAALLNYIGTDGHSPVIVGGDLNTHTFSAGTRIGAFKNLVRLLTAPETVASTLLSPMRVEPLLRELESFGFRLEGFNDRAHTCRVDESQLLESSGLPVTVKALLKRRFRHRATSLDFRLDWLAGRRLRPLRCGEIIDSATRTPSISAHTIMDLEYRGCPVSDHNPVVADVAVTAPRPRE